MIRRATVGDHETVLSLLLEQLSDHEIHSDRSCVSEVISQVLADERRGFVLLAKAGPVTAGIAYLAIILSVEHGGRAGWLEELYVLPEYRGQGIGTALVQAVFEEAQTLGLSALDLEVDATHRLAESFYARLGFARLSRSRWTRKIEARFHR